AELDLIDGQKVLYVLDLRDGVLDLAIDDVLDGERVDSARVPVEEFIEKLRRVGKGGVDHRQILLGRRQDDEATIDLVGVEIIRVTEFGRDLRREAGAVDLEGGKRGGLQAESHERLIVALDEMRLPDRQQAAIDEVVVA